MIVRLQPLLLYHRGAGVPGLGSLTIPLVTLFAVPLTVLSLPSLLGILLLIGIVVSNAILLVGFASKARDRNDGAMIEADRTCPRPILMAMLATSTFLALLVIPVGCSLLKGARGRRRRGMSGRSSKASGLKDSDERADNFVWSKTMQKVVWTSTQDACIIKGYSRGWGPRSVSAGGGGSGGETLIGRSEIYLKAAYKGSERCSTPPVVRIGALCSLEEEKDES